MEPKNLDARKTLSLTDGNGHTHEFLGEAEKEVISAKQNYYKWLSRLFIFFATLSLLVFMSSSLALFNLAPQVSVEPFLIIKQDASENIVRYEPISEDMASETQLMEAFIKQYVILRNTILRDEGEMMLRWYPGGMVNFLSSDYVFSEFDAYRRSVWQKMLDSKIVREVEIISVDRALKIRYWTASVTAFFFRERQFVGLRLINPIGFTVVRYSQTEVAF